MSNGVRARILPHLTPEEISDRDFQELRLDRELSKCQRGSEFDAERAFQVLRAYTVEIFKVVYPAFQKKIGYESAWTADIVGDTIFRAMTVYTGHNVYGMPSLGELSQTLEATLLDHLKELKNTGPQSPRLQLPVAVEPHASPGIGEELKQLLIDCRCRPEDIAEEIGIQPRNVYRHLAGETVPSLVNVGKYEKALSKRLGRSVKLPLPAKRQ